MRQGEILSLRWKHIDLSKGIATLDMTKNGERRSIPLNRTAWGLLRSRNSVRYLSCENVFTSSVGTPLDSGNVRRGICRRLRRHGSKAFAFMISDTLSPRGWCRGVSISIGFRNYSVTRTSRRRSVMRITVLKA